MLLRPIANQLAVEKPMVFRRVGNPQVSNVAMMPKSLGKNKKEPFREGSGKKER
ncbi:MAG: hypothetical protein NTW59_00380 [Candidatus Diapherotrites archaeon]|nr:hypothetical protein [Candidatus Diapherotrites archaeon]